MPFFSASEEEAELVSALSFLTGSLALVSRDFLGGADVSFLSFDLERLGSDAPVVAAPTPSLSRSPLAEVLYGILLRVGFQERERHTVSLNVILVAVAAHNTLFHPLRFSGLGLDGHDPASALSGRSCLKDMFMAVEMERKVIRAFFGHVGDLGLPGKFSDNSCGNGARKEPTRLSMPDGAALSSARLAKNKRPLPVS